MDEKTFADAVALVDAHIDRWRAHVDRLDPAVEDYQRLRAWGESAVSALTAFRDAMPTLHGG